MEVIIMAGSLEFAKLVVASLLYQYWDTINKILKGYLVIACFILMVITSGGIYGFLSGAYQSTATQSELLDKSLSILNQKQIRFEEQKVDLTLEKTQINKSISDLRISLSNPTSVSYWDENSQSVITTTSSSTRRALQAELKTSIADRDNLNIKLEAILDSINTTDMALLDKEIDNEAERELGPLKYLAETTGRDMGVVVNWFLLLIVFVFDPLAIALVVAANMAFAQIKKKEPDVEVLLPKEFNKPAPVKKIKKAIKKVQRKQELSGEQLQTGLDAMIEVFEEEEAEKKSKEEEIATVEWQEVYTDAGEKRKRKVYKTADGQIVKYGELEALKAEHEFYHKEDKEPTAEPESDPKLESGVTRKGNSKKRTRKKSKGVPPISNKDGKPPGWIKNWTNV